MPLIDLFAIEYANTPKDSKSPFSREIRALCTLLDKTRVYPAGVSGLPDPALLKKGRIIPFRDEVPEELETPDMAELGIVQ